MPPKNTTFILKKLRDLLKSKQHVAEPIQAYIIPSGDSHQNEYISDCDCRREYISGFAGSSGTAIVTENLAALWTDGRYFLQAASQMDSNWTLMKQGLPETPSQEEWLNKVLPIGSKVGVDPYLFSYDMWKTCSKGLKAAGNYLVPVSDNLVDIVWGSERPEPPCSALMVQDIKFSGLKWEKKVELLRTQMAANVPKADHIVVTHLDEIAWLLNLRGSDIAYNPVFFSYLVIDMNSIHLFMDEKKLSDEIEKHLDGDLKVTFHGYDDIQSFISDLYTENDAHLRTWISTMSSHALVSTIPKKSRILKPCPITESKSVKNPVEIEGMKRAHIRDAVALCEYFRWLEEEVPKGKVTEISGADRLEEFRREQDDFVTLSFQTISSSGPHAAVIHYSPSLETDLPITMQDIYLCDSGAQFRDGTTDVTRTMHFGAPTQHQKECTTRVLKGVIALATSVFPNGTKGSRLDSFARKSLWDAGLDYLHGTGHGVGSFLNVHEGPQRVSYRLDTKETALTAGQFISDEPGYYEDGQFGIRIENIVLVKPTTTEHNFRDKGFLTFETVTLAPIQTKLLEPSLLTEAEITWLNDYHNQCREVIGAELEKQGRHEALKWLVKETQPIG
ncbi:putative xaa-Pro aminopeptidase 1 isoform X1 [Apostichopus japonicus]|uniref:Putative xaa-Pro aminopeptidase 1 isoform X1 n=1 Tax=Stichopus japonicus TaxID=307972 RepID=A0A2G8L0N3_STIJA|nr:putative xaa-Pro aminopeptidase 1 isoform X1 [Apostichopus japonicus]